jgi:hypothetical protein
MDTVMQLYHSDNLYYSFITIKTGSTYLFSVTPLKYSDKGIYFTFMQKKYMTDFGLFKYKKNIVFVSGGIDPYYFFSKTNKTKHFRFIQNGDVYDKIDDIGDLNKGNYEYINGVFHLKSEFYNDKSETVK